MRILVVDDDPAMREMLKMLLRHWGFEVREAPDAHQGMELVERFQPDVVLSDIKMPGLSGIELARLIKAKHPSLPVILMTADQSITVPPLRERKEDLRLLVRKFIREFNYKHQTCVKSVRREVFQLMKNYDWPGNVRELRNVLELAVHAARQGWIETVHLPAGFRLSLVVSVAKLVNLAKSATVNGRKSLCLLRPKFAHRRGFAKNMSFATETS